MSMIVILLFNYMLTANTPDLVPGTMTPSVSKATTAPYRFGVFTVDFDQQVWDSVALQFSLWSS